MGWEGGWGGEEGGLSRRGEIGRAACRGRGEGLPPHGGEAHF